MPMIIGDEKIQNNHQDERWQLEFFLWAHRRHTSKRQRADQQKTIDTLPTNTADSAKGAVMKFNRSIAIATLPINTADSAKAL